MAVIFRIYQGYRYRIRSRTRSLVLGSHIQNKSGVQVWNNGLELEA